MRHSNHNLITNRNFHILINKNWIKDRCLRLFRIAIPWIISNWNPSLLYFFVTARLKQIKTWINYRLFSALSKFITIITEIWPSFDYRKWLRFCHYRLKYYCMFPLFRLIILVLNINVFRRSFSRKFKLSDNEDW